MEYAYATCLLSETGEEINEENLKAVLEAAGSPVQESRIKAVVAALEDIDIGAMTASELGTGQDGSDRQQPDTAEQSGSPATDEEQSTAESPDEE